jgi:hypothetical protein
MGMGRVVLGLRSCLGGELGVNCIILVMREKLESNILLLEYTVHIVPLQNFTWFRRGR